MKSKQIRVGGRESAAPMLFVVGYWLLVRRQDSGSADSRAGDRPNLSIVIRYNEAVFLISKELLKRCPTRAAALVGPA